MTFSIYALLGSDSPAISNESLASDLAHYFRNEKDFKLEFEQLPFAKSQTLKLNWGVWLVRVAYEEGENVRQDSAHIQEAANSSVQIDLSDISKRIRIVFGQDDAQEYTNQIVYLMDFLREIPGVVICDPQQREVVGGNV